VTKLAAKGKSCFSVHCLLSARELLRGPATARRRGPSRGPELLAGQALSQHAVPVLSNETTQSVQLASPVLQCAMDLAYMTGLRQRELLCLSKANIKIDVLRVSTSKTGTVLEFELTSDLKAISDRCWQLPTRLMTMHLIHNRAGYPYTSSGFRANWTRLMRKALREGVIAERFTFHDIRAKSASDHESGEHLGHDDAKTLRRYYLRKPRKVVPVSHKVSHNGE